MTDNVEEKKKALHYMETLVDVARESFLILDSNLRVISGNPTFYETFKVSPEETEDKLLYNLGNNQWNIPELRKLLENILPSKKVVREYLVNHTFESIGQKTMVLNARQIDTVQLIILAIEDVSEREDLRKKLLANVKELEVKVSDRTAELTEKVKDLEALNESMVGRELKMVELKKEVEELKKKVNGGK